MNARSGPPPLLVSYTDLSDVWSETGLAAADNDVASTLNLQQVPVKTQNLAVRLLKDVQTRLVQSSVSERLCVDWGGSPASWFRQPVAELVTWRCPDWDGWKKNFRLQVRLGVVWVSFGCRLGVVWLSFGCRLVSFGCRRVSSLTPFPLVQLRAMAHARSPTDPIPIFVYVTNGPLDKSAKVVLDAVQKELAPRAVVHLGQKGTIGMQVRWLVL